MTACSPSFCGWTADVPPGQMVGEVWWCGDDYCDCGQAQINLPLQTVWEGSFQSDGDGWRPAGEYKDEPECGVELSRMARHLRKHHRQLYGRIKWPWGGPYPEKP